MHVLFITVVDHLELLLERILNHYYGSRPDSLSSLWEQSRFFIIIIWEQNRFFIIIMGAEQILYNHDMEAEQILYNHYMGAEQILYHNYGSRFFIIIIWEQNKFFIIIIAAFWRRSNSFSSLWEQSRFFIIIMGVVSLPSLQEQRRSFVNFIRKQMLYHHYGSGSFTIILGAQQILCHLYKKADALSSLWEQNKSFIIIMGAESILYHHYWSLFSIIAMGVDSFSSLCEQIIYNRNSSRPVIIIIFEADSLSLL